MPGSKNPPSADRSDAASENASDEAEDKSAGSQDQQREIGGRNGLDPTRFGDWEKNGRCIDF